jgi:hypothetical protein
LRNAAFAFRAKVAHGPAVRREALVGELIKTLFLLAIHVNGGWFPRDYAVGTALA